VFEIAGKRLEGKKNHHPFARVPLGACKDRKGIKRPMMRGPSEHSLEEAESLKVFKRKGQASDNPRETKKSHTLSAGEPGPRSGPHHGLPPTKGEETKSQPNGSHKRVSAGQKRDSVAQLRTM